MLTVSHMTADRWPTEILSTKEGGDRYLDWTCSPAGLRLVAEKIRNGELALVPTQKNGTMPGDKVIGVCEICGLTVVRRADGVRAHIGWTRPEETWHDSVTAQDRREEFERIIVEEERKAAEIKARQEKARALPTDGVVHTLKAMRQIEKNAQPRRFWWRWIG